MSVETVGKQMAAGEPANSALKQLVPFEAEGLRFELSHYLETEAGVPGYLFTVSHPDGTPIGEACAMIATDPAAVARSGHLGCSVLPEFRKRGYPLRIGRALVPVARSHGVADILFTCASGNESMKQTFRELGADEMPPAEGNMPEVSRFLLKST